MDWLKLKTSIGLSTALVSGTLGAALGGWDSLLKALVIIICLDYVSGLLAAFIEKKLNSGIGFRGVAKKVFIFVLVGASHTVGELMGFDLLRQIVIGFYIGIEGLSILENASRANLPVPEALKNALLEIRSRSEKGSVKK